MTTKILYMNIMKNVKNLVLVKEKILRFTARTPYNTE